MVLGAAATDPEIPRRYICGLRDVGGVKPGFLSATTGSHLQVSYNWTHDSEKEHPAKAPPEALMARTSS